MNTDLVTPSTQKTSGQPVGLPSDVPQSKIKVAGPAWSQNSKIPTPVHRKIAKLPKPLRDLINSSLDDGLSARQIIEKLQASTNPPLPYPISAMNISDW